MASMDLQLCDFVRKPRRFGDIVSIRSIEETPSRKSPCVAAAAQAVDMSLRLRMSWVFKRLVISKNISEVKVDALRFTHVVL